MKLGIIGAGNIGGTLGRLWAKAGHEIRFGVRDETRVQPLLDELGANASIGTAVDAAAFGDVIVFAGPYGAWPDFAHATKGVLDGKAVFDAANPYPARDGAIVDEIAKAGHGSGTHTASLLPGAHVVKAFNTIYWVDLREKAHQAGEQLAMPIAGDGAEAVAVAERLSHDAGFDPVVVGGLDRSKDLDPGSPIYAKSFTAAQVRRTLRLHG